MLGRIRACSLSSLEVLEMEERTPSKLLKHDSLSIYGTPHYLLLLLHLIIIIIVTIILLLIDRICFPCLIAYVSCDLLLCGNLYPKHFVLALISKPRELKQVNNICQIIGIFT